MRFILPAVPVVKDTPPIGPDWLHEVKFDGWRAQIHRHDGTIKLYSRNGHELAKHFPTIRDACLHLPNSVIDAELVASNEDGRPDFTAIRRNHPSLCVWCFDLLEIAAQDIRSLPLVERREKLRDVLIHIDDDTLRFSEEFTDPVKLLAAADRMGLEGVVSKRRNSAYISGTRSGWVKVKSATWRAANKNRWEMFRRKTTA
jgi:bifunctional non-homologous end joining protein LigD